MTREPYICATCQQPMIGAGGLYIAINPPKHPPCPHCGIACYTQCDVGLSFARAYEAAERRRRAEKKADHP